ncbi:hypothetical protein L3X38_038635 [Prunus dulcis]|uniref:RNase H type-1 domain-containing protein n=1 Tax=Prunus dulcis TaxID=3755 RepID=A0AAD4V784_PRUDU|nr:hypothetical protein L3X38_038635 [Prunus dulcis]
MTALSKPQAPYSIMSCSFILSILGKCSNSVMAINSVLGDVSSSNWELYPILKDIRFLKASFTNLNWAWVPREANRSVDVVASLARKAMCLESWLVRPPSSLVHILSRDGLPCPPPDA